MTYQPATPATDAILRQLCSKCGTKTRLIGIEADKAGYDLHTFECPACGSFQTSVAAIAPL
jgi:hypothetical protein